MKPFETNKVDRPPFQPVDESSLNRLLSKHYQDGFIIITSYRGDNESNVNKSSFKELMTTVQRNKYSFIPVYGGFIENKGTPDEREVKEPALLVPNHSIGTANPNNEDNLKALGIQLCQAYNQDSFLYKPAGEENTAYYIDKTGNVDMEFNNKSVNDLTQIYFTKLNKRSQTDKRFTFTEELFFNQSPIDGREAIRRFGEQFFKVLN